MKISFGCFWLAGLLLLTGCASTFFTPAPTVFVTTATPEKLQLVNGRLNACLLLTTSEIESALTTKTTPDPFAFDGGTGCRYDFSAEESPAVVVFVYNEITVESLGLQWTVDDWFEIEKKKNLEFATQVSQVKVEDVSGLGDKAYYRDGRHVNLYILENGIEYVFTTTTPEYGGKGSLPAIISLAKIALQRMP
ncbi:MAG TPA: hypothetical protein PKH47_14105 [Anaerolineales bacterium]|nr:hypothetical protein [Anaerolineales bacterium]